MIATSTYPLGVIGRSSEELTKLNFNYKLKFVWIKLTGGCQSAWVSGSGGTAIKLPAQVVTSTLLTQIPSSS
jgi:hypothetical protein